MTVWVAPAVVTVLAMEMAPALPRSSELPMVVPIVKAEGEDVAVPKVMLPMPSGVALGRVPSIRMVVVALVKNVATSVLVIESKAPGKVPGPVLQLFSAPAASHMPFVGVEFQVALAACAEWQPISAATVPARMMAVLFWEVKRWRIFKGWCESRWDGSAHAGCRKGTAATASWLRRR